MHNEASSLTKRFTISDEDCLNQLRLYEKHSKQISVSSRTVFWHSYFLVSVVAFILMYLSIFIIADYYYITTDETVYLFTDESTRNFLVFVSFWAGVYRVPVA
jgi:hypothetical protein